MNDAVVRSITVISVLIMGFVILPAAAQFPGSMTTFVHSFRAGDSLSADFESSGEVSIFQIVGVKGEIDAGFFVGVDLPAEFRITYPAWVDRGSHPELLLNADGLPGGRVGLEVHAGVKVSFYFLAGLGSIGVIDVYKELDLTAELTTPIGVSVAKPLERRIEIGSITIPLLVTSVKVSLYFGVTASVSVAGSLVSDLLVDSSSLVSNLEETLLWDDENETLSREFIVRESAVEDIRLSLSQTRLRLDTYSIVIESVFVELEAAGYTLPRLAIPIPYGFSIPVSSGTELGCSSPADIIMHVFNPEAPMQIDSDAILIFAVVAGVIVVLALVSRRV